MGPLNFDFSAVTQIDWARLASFIDGEGHIRIVCKTQKVKGRTYPHEYLDLLVTNTNPILMQWLTKTFGGSIQPLNRKNSKHRQAWSWDVGSKHASEILARCLPYFICKKDQAEIALAFYATMKRWGMKGMPQSVRDHRQVLKTKLRVLTARGPRAEAAG